MRSGSGCWGWQWLTWSVLIAPCASSSSLSSRVSSAHGVRRECRVTNFCRSEIEFSNLQTWRLSWASIGEVPIPAQSSQKRGRSQHRRHRMPLASLLPLGIIMGAIGVCGTLLSVIPYATRGEVRARTHARAQARRGHAHAEAAIRGVRRQRCARHSRHVPCCGSRTSWHCQRLRSLLNWQDRQDRQLWQPWKSWHGCGAGGSRSAANSSKQQQ